MKKYQPRQQTATQTGIAVACNALLLKPTTYLKMFCDINNDACTYVTISSVLKRKLTKNAYRNKEIWYDCQFKDNYEQEIYAIKVPVLPSTIRNIHN